MPLAMDEAERDQAIYMAQPAAGCKQKSGRVPSAATSWRVCEDRAPTNEGAIMWARVAKFEGNPDDVDARVARLREMVDSGGLPPELAEAKFLLLADRETGGMLGVTLFDSEEAMLKADVVMNAGGGRAGARTGVEFYEVPISIGV
jgi:hypothetical protein